MQYLVAAVQCRLGSRTLLSVAMKQHALPSYCREGSLTCLKFPKTGKTWQVHANTCTSIVPHVIGCSMGTHLETMPF